MNIMQGKHDEVVPSGNSGEFLDRQGESDNDGYQQFISDAHANPVYFFYLWTEGKETFPDIHENDLHELLIKYFDFLGNNNEQVNYLLFNRIKQKVTEQQFLESFYGWMSLECAHGYFDEKVLVFFEQFIDRKIIQECLDRFAHEHVSVFVQGMLSDYFKLYEVNESEQKFFILDLCRTDWNAAVSLRNNYQTLVSDDEIMNQLGPFFTNHPVNAEAVLSSYYIAKRHLTTLPVERIQQRMAAEIPDFDQFRDSIADDFSFDQFLVAHGKEEPSRSVERLSKEVRTAIRDIVSYFSDSKILEAIDPQYLPHLQVAALSILEPLYRISDSESSEIAFEERVKLLVRMLSREILSPEDGDLIHERLRYHFKRIPWETIYQPSDLLKYVVSYLLPKIESATALSREYYRQSSGIEIEILFSTTSDPIKSARLKRSDWSLLHLFGIGEDVEEKELQTYEISTDPTDTVSSQSILVNTLLMARFLEPSLLDGEHEVYSIHASTVFPEEVWSKGADDYEGLSGIMGIAFSSQERIKDAGFIFGGDGSAGMYADKTKKSKRPVKKKAILLLPEPLLYEEQLDDGRLIEMRIFDVTPDIFSALQHKEVLDYAFCQYEKLNKKIGFRVIDDTVVAEDEEALHMQAAFIFRELLYDVKKFKQLFEINFSQKGFNELAQRDDYPQIKKWAQDMIRHYAARIRRTVVRYDRSRNIEPSV